MKAWTATQIEPGKWTFAWTPTAGRVYEVWYQGELLHTTAAGIGTYTTDGGGPTDAPPPVEIHDTVDGLAQNEEYTPRAILQWRGVAGVAGYQVEQLRGSWLPVHNATERGAGWYSYNTGVMVDRVVGQFRVTALDNRGLSGAAVSFNVRVTCNPVPPVVTDVGCLAGTLTVGVT